MSERRITAYLVGFGFLFLLLILAAFLGRSFLSSVVNKESWTKQNERVLSTLPLYPGATEARAPYSTGERAPNVKTKTANGGPYRGYWTTHTYTLPPEAGPALVLGYYAQHIGNWSLEPVLGTSCEVTYSHGPAMLDLKACDGQLKLSVNYRELG